MAMAVRQDKRRKARSWRLIEAAVQGCGIEALREARKGFQRALALWRVQGGALPGESGEGGALSGGGQGLKPLGRLL